MVLVTGDEAALLPDATDLAVTALDRSLRDAQSVQLASAMIQVCDIVLEKLATLHRLRVVVFAGVTGHHRDRSEAKGQRENIRIHGSEWKTRVPRYQKGC